MEIVSHTTLKLLVPEGTGMHVPVTLEIDTSRHGASVLTSNTLDFHYDPPYLSYLTPNTPDANGDVISIYGTNFGATREHADKVKVWIGGLPCTAVSLGDDSSTAQHIWQKGPNDETAYLWCVTSRLRVGPQAVTVSVAQQNVTWTVEEEKIETTCVYGYYGQEAWTVLTSADDTVCDECGAKQVECMRWYNETTGGYVGRQGGWPTASA